MNLSGLLALNRDRKAVELVRRNAVGEMEIPCQTNCYLARDNPVDD